MMVCCASSVEQLSRRASTAQDGELIVDVRELPARVGRNPSW